MMLLVGRQPPRRRVQEELLYACQQMSARAKAQTQYSHVRPAHPSPSCVYRTTSSADLQIRARERGIPVHVIHNASVMNAVGACGLQLYRFGEAISICFFTETWKPDSFYDRCGCSTAGWGGGGGKL
jgi:hypothetical protein